MLSPDEEDSAEVTCGWNDGSGILLAGDGLGSRVGEVVDSGVADADRLATNWRLHALKIVMLSLK